MPDTQEALPGTGDGPAFDPAQHGLWQRFVDGDQVAHGAWLRACAEHTFVGTCRVCGDYLTPAYPEQLDGRTDYEARCRSERCGHTVVAPGGRLLRRSSRHSQMPAGWWDHRFKTAKG